MVKDTIVEAKLQLIKWLQEKKSIGAEEKEFINFFYKWRELGFPGALREFEKIKRNEEREKM